MKKLRAESRKNLVLDTYAVIGFFYGEEGFQQVQSVIDQATDTKITLLFNEISIGEFYYRIWKSHSRERAEQGLTYLTQLPLTYVPIDRAFILAASSWKGQYAISYADAFVVETAMRNSCSILTGDPEFDTIPHLEIIRLGRK